MGNGSSYAALSKALSNLKDRDDDHNNNSDTAEQIIQARLQSLGSQGATTTSLSTGVIAVQQQQQTMPVIKAPVTTQAVANTTTTLDAQKSDFGGKMTSFSKNGIHITLEDPDHSDKTPGTMTWIDTGKAAAGIGVIGNGNKGKDTGAENVTVDLDDAVDSITISLVDHGTKNSDDDITFQIYQEGGAGPTEVTLSLDSNAPEKVTSFTFNAADYGDGSMISQVTFYSTSNTPGQMGEASFLIGGIEATVYSDTPDPVPAPQPDPVDNPVFIVGHNVDDTAGSTVDYIVGEGHGTINGGNNSDVLVGDVGGAYTLNPPPVDFNVVMMLDVSGSMIATFADGTTRLDHLVDAVENLLADFNSYDNGTIQVHIVPFDTTAWGMDTFTVTDDTAFSDAITFLNNLTPGGVTNYESALKAGINWLQGNEPIQGAVTASYFVSDGYPNYAVDDATGNYTYSYYSGLTAMDEILGLDGSNEVEQIQSLSDEVIGVGINIGSSISNLDLIDSNGSAINVTDSNQLSAAFQDSNPLNKLDPIGDDVINGGDGQDFIFGDALHTDKLANDHGLNTMDGAGWDVFAQLEAGQSQTDPNWSRDDTLAYILNNTEELSVENIDQEGAGRIIGNDTLNGGGGGDYIFGQEGNDLITGGGGNDILYGGSGADSFIFEAITDGHDTIKDFDATIDILDFSNLLTGYNPLQDSLDDFIFATETDGNTVIAVDTSGTGSSNNAVEMVTLEGVTNLDLVDLTNNGNLVA